MEFLILLVLLVVGGVTGSGLTLLGVYWRSRLNEARERQLRIEMADETSQRVSEILEQVMTRFELLEERLEFSERLMLERGREYDKGQDDTGET